MVTFARHMDGIGIWRDGELIGVIPVSKLPALIYEAASRLRAG